MPRCMAGEGLLPMQLLHLLPQKGRVLGMQKRHLAYKMDDAIV